MWDKAKPFRQTGEVNLCGESRRKLITGRDERPLKLICLFKNLTNRRYNLDTNWLGLMRSHIVIFLIRRPDLIRCADTDFTTLRQGNSLVEFLSLEDFLRPPQWSTLHLLSLKEILSTLWNDSPTYGFELRLNNHVL